MKWNLELLKHDNILNNISGVTFSLMNKKSKKYSHLIWMQLGKFPLMLERFTRILIP